MRCQVNTDKDTILLEMIAFRNLMLATGFFRFNLEQYNISLSESLEYQALCKELGWIV